MRHNVMGWRRVLGSITVVWATAAATGGCGTIVTADVSPAGGVPGCPTGFEFLSVNSLEALGPYRLARLIDTAGNNNGKVCGRLLADVARDAECVKGSNLACQFEQRGLSLYRLTEDDNPARYHTAVAAK